MRLNTAFKIILWFVAFSIVSISLFFLIKVYIPSSFSLDINSASSASVQNVVRPILFEKLLGDIGQPTTGDNGWYKVFLEKIPQISQLSLDDRINVYVILMINMDFDAESIDSFCKIIRRDARSLHVALLNFAQQKKFQLLSEEERIKILMLDKKSISIFLTGEV